MFEEGNPEEQMLDEAKEALRLGNRVRARELLTRLLKTDQNNATYWVWMSAAMDTQKERIYCLQTALKLDPDNVAAKRGLVMHGALPPDDSIPPFPLNRPRPWEDKVTVAGEEDRPRGFKAFWANPFARLGTIIFVAILLIALTLSAFNRAQQLIPAPTRTPGPSPTYTITVTLLPTPTPFIRTPTPTFVGPTPLAMMLDATYTPTPLYVDTPHPAVEAYRAGIRYFNVADYPNSQLMMDQVIFIEPNAADAYYYKGLSALAQQDYENAVSYFRAGTDVDASFAPNYVGYAAASIEQGGTGRVLDDLERAFELDPDFLDAYLVRAHYYLLTDDPESALADAGTAIALAPGSPLGYLYVAEAQLALDNPAEALEAALTASGLDFTNLDAYRLLGRAYIADDQPEKAIGPLQTYTLYRADEPEAFLLLGDAYYAADDFENAVTAYTRALALDSKLGEAYARRGRAYLALGDADKAIDDLDSARLYLPNTLDANLVVAQAYMLKEEPNNAYALLLRVERLVDTDRERAEYLYWRALSLEGMDELEAAANDWEALLALPAEAVPAALQLEAEQRLAAIHTPTPSRTPTVTRTPTRTPLPSATP